MSDDKDKIEDNKQNYVFFNDPDIIAKRAELLALKNQQQKIFNQSRECNNFQSSNQRLQPYPFTFISAVRRKLELEAQHEAEGHKLESKVDHLDDKMDFIKPLKVPDLKISPKTVDYSPRDHLQRNVRSEEMIDKSSKSAERVNRKLEFLSSQSSLANEDIKQLKAPDIQYSSFSRKKLEQRDSSRDKINKTKRIKKDDGDKSKDDEAFDNLKKRNTKHIPRRDLIDPITVKSTGKSSTERSHSRQRDKKSFGLMASKTDEKKSSRPGQMKSSRDRSVEMKGKVTSSESISDRKPYDYITHRSDLRASNDYTNQSVNGLRLDDQKYRIGSDNKVLKHQMTKDKHKKILDKCKTSKIYHRSTGGTFVDCHPDDIEDTKSDSIYTELSSALSKSKDDKVTLVSTQQNLTTSDVNSLNDKNINITQSSDESFLDSKKISFRDDSYSQQEEFCNLVTPDLNLVYRPKRKKDQRSIKTFQESSVDDGLNHVVSSKHKLQQNEKQEEDVPLLHPTALHMQFQAELHLFDSYNESIRQVMDVENSLYNVKQDQAREKLQQKLITEQSNKLTNTQVDEQKQQQDIIISDNNNDEKNKLSTKVEVQTQTANDIATQTDTMMTLSVDPRIQHPGVTYRRGSFDFGSIDIEDLDQLEEIPLPNKMRAMSEISLHETTSSIKTETGTEISISTRDVTYSFNKFLDLEMAQLIKDERQTNDKIEMLFRSHEKTLYDRTRKLVKLEEQKRALRDTGQDSRISSVKKKQRALLLKLQQEKDEMNRLKELHKKASQERKLMLQKQRNMLNPQMSTKNFLTKLKRSADCQSPRRLSGPMKGYDIRSNSSISSLVDSDKSQIDRSNLDEKLEVSDMSIEKLNEKLLKRDEDACTSVDSRGNKYSQLFEESSNSSRLESPSKYQLKTRKFEEKMPKSDLLRLKAHHMNLESKLQQARQSNQAKSFNISSDLKSESDTLVEELSKKSKLRDRSEENKKNDKTSGERDALKKAQYNQDLKLSKRKTGKNPKVKTPANILTENILKMNANSDDLKNNKRSKIERDFLPTEDSHQSILEEINLNDSQNSLQALVKHSRAVKEKNYKLLRDIAHEHEAKENISEQMINRDSMNKNDTKIRDNNNDVQNQENISTRSQVSTFTISRHSSGDSEKSYSRSVVIRSQQDHQFKTSKKLEQVLHAREAALATRRNCVEDWIAYHAKLKAEESRIIRMEEAALKLISASSNALSCNDTTVSSDTSDVEGRVELLVEKLAQRRAEMAKLKKEARKQAKQRLKTLEANLLNQITKYDITINEMRKKLEQKRNLIKESGKLAIEAKSIADVKVPEIPIKNIQELYKTNDLSRSRSESDLITKNIYSLTKKTDKEVDYESSSSLVTKNTSKSVEKDKTTSRSIESVLEEARRTLSSRSTESRNDSEASRDQKSTENSKKSSEMNKESTEIDESKLENVKSNESSTIHTKTDIKSGSDVIEEEFNEESGSLFSNKIDLLHLNNKNLTEDINTLENDLRTLSEMVSRFSKKSDDKSASIYNHTTIETEKSSAKEITEDFSQSEVVESIQNLSKVTEIDEKSSEIDNKLPQASDADDKTMQSIHSEVISTIIPSKSESYDSKLSEEIDFEAKSKAILNVVEQSIIQDHGKLTGNNFELSGAALEQSMLSLHKDNEALSSDFNSLEGDIKSISKIISQITGNKQTLTDTNLSQSNIDQKLSETQELSKRSESNEEETSVSKEVEKLEEESSFIEEELEDSDHESSYSSQKINQSAKDTSYRSSFDKLSKTEEEEEIDNNDENEELSRSKASNNWTISDSFEAVDADLIEEKSPEIKEDDERNNTTDIQVSLFIPRGESTNIQELYAIHSDMSEDINGITKEKIENSIADELDDILDIIERDRKESSVQMVQHSIAPTEVKLQQAIGNKFVEKNNELNLTAEVEPALQKLTEILENVENNFAKKTRDRDDRHEVDVRSYESITISKSRQEDDPIPTSETEKEVSNQFITEIPDLDIQNNESISENRQSIAEVDGIIDQKDENDDKENEDQPKSVAILREIIKDPEYDDISEESLEVSEILDKSKSQKSNKIPEKFEAVPQTDVVLQILDSISQQSLLKKSLETQKSDISEPIRVVEEISEVSSKALDNREVQESVGVTIEELGDTSEDHLAQEESKKSTKLDENDKSVDKDEISSEISEDADTPKGVSEIDLDSPRDQNDSRLDVDILNDDLLIESENDKSNKDIKGDNQTGGITTEKDIEMMISKLQVSLDQPGLEVVEFNAKLLRIEQLQIELKIKKLEAEEKSFYVREIPNKPPPPYTPPGIGGLSPESSPILSPSIVPTNVEDLTAFTEKATIIIFNAKQFGKDIMKLEAPPEIYEFNKDNNEIIKKDRKIYNTFLFDLCKETIAEVYQGECEKPGPSWTKPNVKTKPAIKIPRTVEELNEYVSKEVATLFGFKTKLQRENMVMRWSRKRRDRVDELLAREAQAEEDEWTKFHHDELAVKNELTLAILNPLLIESMNDIKNVYIKKRRTMV
ncbi:centrosome-associated protein 350-like [Chelonus insularis]|uniref:centrosome-associated protein 350-like n=1 Tax=Chelonus insularis TaxID=460826 RepID=UPI00158E21B6|nr:centrosome-associated protein 350-like [Chelonus insularis]